MERKRMILHIGYFKTGTSSIQHYLRDHADELRSDGVLWPRTGRIVYANHSSLALLRMHEERAIELPYRFARRRYERSGRAVWQDLMAEIEASGCHTTILSSEYFVHLAEDETTRSIIDEIAEYLAPFDTTVVVYVRRNDDYLEAMFNQRVKSGQRLQPLEDTLGDEFQRIHRDYAHGIGAWADRFGDDHTKVRVFSRDRLEGGDAVTDFMATIGLAEFASRHPPSEDRNQRLPNHLLELKRIVNHLERHAGTRSAVNDVLRAMDAADPGPTGRLLSPDARARILERSAATNAEVARRYLGSDEPLFRPDDHPGLRVEPTERDLLELVLGLQLHLVATQRKHHQALEARLDRIEAGQAAASTTIPPRHAPDAGPVRRVRRVARRVARRFG